ncbi:alpha/beta fold hydrolase [Pseudoroseicyclus sp. H15]
MQHSTLHSAVSRSQPTIHFLDIPADEAKADELPLLLLHGVGSSSHTWRRLLRQLDRRRIVAPDYRGHGRSAAPPPPYEADDFVEDAFRLMDELDIPRAHVLGFSIGALFAERMALAQPDRVASLVLLSSIADRTEAQRTRAAERLEQLSTTPPRETAPASAARWFTPGFLAANPELIAEEVQLTANIDHAAYASAYKVLVENDPIDIVAGIGCPTLVMTGEDDIGSTPAMSQALTSRIPGARLKIVPAIRHYMHLEAPERLAPEINAFLSDCETARHEAAPGT